jgi:hypothetical protein
MSIMSIFFLTLVSCSVHVCASLSIFDVPASSVLFEVDVSSNATPINGKTTSVHCRDTVFLFVTSDFDSYVASLDVKKQPLRLALLPPGFAASHQGLACDERHNRIFVVGEGAWLFDLAALSLRRLSDLPLPRSNPSAVVIAGHLHVFGGVDETLQPASEHWIMRLDDEGNLDAHWHLVPYTVPESGVRAVAVAVDNTFVLYFGGVDQYDATSHSSKSAAAMQFGYRCRVVVSVMGGACWEPFFVPKSMRFAPNTLVMSTDSRAGILCIGGDLLSSDVHFLDVFTLQWTKLPSLPVGVHSGVVAQKNDEIFLISLRPPAVVLRANLASWNTVSVQLAMCLQSLNLRELHLDPSASFESAREGRPVAIALASSLSELAAIVKCANAARVPACGRGGLHGFTGESGCDRGVAIDIANRSVHINGTRLTVGAGATSGQVMHELLVRNASMFLPLGHSATVSLSGLTLSGERGFLARMHGLISDHLVSFSGVHKVDGSLVEPNVHDNLSLLFTRDGGSSFQAIFWQLTFKLVALGDISITRVRIDLQASAAASVLASWQAKASAISERNVYLEARLDRFDKSVRLLLLGVLVAPKSQSVADTESQALSIVRQALPADAQKYVLRESVERLALSEHILSLPETLSQSSDQLDHVRLHSRWHGRSIGTYKQFPVAFFEKLSDWLVYDFAAWRQENNLTNLDGCFVEMKPQGGGVVDSSERSALPHHSAIGWLLLNCFFQSNATRLEEARILAATRTLKMNLLQELSQEHAPFSYAFYEADDPTSASYAPTGTLQRCSSTNSCGPPLVDVPTCNDGRLRGVACVGAPRTACEWRILTACVGTKPLQRVRQGAAGEPVIAIVLTGQLTRMITQNKFAHIFSAHNMRRFSFVVVAALSTSPPVFRKTFGAGMRLPTHSLSSLFYGSIDDMFALLLTKPTDILVYTYQQHFIRSEQLPINDTNHYLRRSTATDKHGAALANVMQFDGLRRAMALVGAWERASGRTVAHVLRLRDDDFSTKEFDLQLSVQLLGRGFDMLASACGAWGGVNDRTYFLRRNSVAFDAVRLGQLEWAYRKLKTNTSGNNHTSGNNPEWLLYKALSAAKARIGYVAPCHFSSFSVRNLTGLICFDWATVLTNTDAQNCKALGSPAILKSCQAPGNENGLVLQESLTYPSCPHLPN